MSAKNRGRGRVGAVCGVCNNCCTVAGLRASQPAPERRPTISPTQSIIRSSAVAATAAPTPRRRRGASAASAAPDAASGAADDAGAASTDAAAAAGAPAAKKAKKAPAGPTRAREAALWARGFRAVAGVDEAGRGPLAGPVVAAACVLPPGIQLPGLDDSKKLNEEQREALYEALTTHPDVVWAT